MKLLKIAQMTLRTAWVFALILGLAFWIGWITPNAGMRGIHMLLGIIVVLALWLMGIAQGLTKGGSLGIGFGTFIVGLAVVIVGLWQDSWKTADNLIIINLVHLLLGLIAIGFGEMIGGRAKRLASATA